ncbi:hypothetical protein HMPREF9123_2939 [Neisseria bacilliformis ATCC BAA-1200]|uniref:Uncharacterized protein n=1 Tax=Neisseria bacilliformis ATCC BAA-1200 TaxID=888742 RepID=F2BGT2_9NEIS|nr:hypothetical protein HMPREF9123_2939 [Neisseria bacilliformis ATCC BAA-1200]
MLEVGLKGGILAKAAARRHRLLYNARRSGTRMRPSEKCICGLSYCMFFL